MLVVKSHLAEQCKETSLGASSNPITVNKYKTNHFIITRYGIVAYCPTFSSLLL